MAQVRSVLIVDDDAELRDALAEQLALDDEFVIEQAGTAAQTLELVERQDIDVIIMDVGLPDMDGRDLVKVLRKNGFNGPIILLTGHAEDSDTVRGLDSGANDYVTKPFRFAVLLARIRAHVRQHESSDDAVFHIGDYTFRPSSKHLVNEKGGKTRLTEKETAILRFLYRASKQVVTRDVLLREVWGYNSNVTTHTLETHIYRLRQKIEADPANARLLVTGDGGYKLLP